MKIILFVSLFFLIGCSDNKAVRIYLIPKGYEGPLLLVEDPKSKNTPKVIGDTTIFDFRNGIVLRFKGKFIEGTYHLSNFRYYYTDSVGNKTEIPITLTRGSKTDLKEYVYSRFTQIGESSQCDLISTSKSLLLNLNKQEKLCDSLLSKYP
jgi:hypothetical protein